MPPGVSVMSRLQYIMRITFTINNLKKDQKRLNYYKSHSFLPLLLPKLGHRGLTPRRTSHVSSARTQWWCVRREVTGCAQRSLGARRGHVRALEEETTLKVTPAATLQEKPRNEPGSAASSRTTPFYLKPTRYTELI